MALYLQQKTAPAWGGYSQFRGPSHALSLGKNHTSLYSYRSGSNGSKEGFEASTRDQVSVDNLGKGLTDTYLSIRKQYSLSVKLWTHNEGHSVSRLLFFKNKLLSYA